MTRTKTLRRIFLFLFFSSICFGNGVAQTQKKPEDSAIPTLLNEVRLLRLTLQRMNLNASRSQIVVERMRFQAEQVSRFTRMLEDLRNEIGEMQLNAAQASERAETLEKQIEEEGNTETRKQKQAEYEMLKQLLKQQKQREQQLKEREFQLTNQTRAEQAKLNDLESRLETLEREIGDEIDRQRNEDNTQKNKKTDRNLD